MQQINPDKQTVQSSLSKRAYYIDFYQREYVWSKSTVDTLLNDIFYNFELSYARLKDSELTEDVIEQYNWYYLNIYITNAVEGKVYIVDGQQRLSTLTLLATKLYHLTKNENLKEVLKECIYGKDMFKGNVYWLDNDKRHNVMEYIFKNDPRPRERMQDDDEDKVPSFESKTEQNLLDRYKDLSAYLNKKSLDENALTAFIYYFLTRLILVELSIDKQDTPMIFEVINDRGEALKSFEILKGKMIGALDKNDTEIYSNKWDEAMKNLRGIRRPYTKLEFSLDLQNDFFIDYIKARYVSLMESKNRDTRLDQSIGEEYHRLIFADNDIANLLQMRRQDKGYISNIKQFIDNDLSYYGKLYARIRSNQDADVLVYLNQVHGMTLQYQLILAACSCKDPEEDKKIVAVAKEIDRFYMLLNLNGIYSSTDYARYLYRLAQQIKDRPVAEMRSFFDKMLRDVIKERRNVAEVPTLLDYNAFETVGYANLNQEPLRYTLARVEEFICREANQRQMDRGDVMNFVNTRSHVNGYHIEHILSHNDTNRAYFESDEEFERSRNQFGGLLLLKGRDNISSGNEEYNEKLKTYSAGLVWGFSLHSDFYHTNVDLNKFNVQLKAKCGMELKPIEIFDKKALEYRNYLIYNIIKIIWEVE